MASCSCFVTGRLGERLDAVTGISLAEGDEMCLKGLAGFLGELPTV
jgi:hypothetical protein